MKNLFDVTVTSASGLEAVVKRELERLGYPSAPAEEGRITLKSLGFKDVAVLNLMLRTASRVLIKICAFKANSFDELFEEVKRTPLRDYFLANSSISVVGKCHKSTLMAPASCASIIKKAAAENLSAAYKTALIETGAKRTLEFDIFENAVSLYLNTSGIGLNKRGYRNLIGDAPLKETTAAAMLDLAFYRGQPFCDLFCGSGTLPIEAAKIALNIPSGIDRDFDFLHFEDYPTGVFNEVKEEAKANIKDEEICVSGFDIDEKQISLARYHAKRAGVEKYIHLQRMDMREFSSARKNGLIVSNPPYGNRELAGGDVLKLYRDLRGVYEKLDNWGLAVLTSHPSFESAFGKSADKKRKLYSGKMECYYYMYRNEKPKK